jgi:hypothetical protein
VWTKGDPAEVVAMSADGQRAAWLDGEGTVRVVRGGDGTSLYDVGPDTYGAEDVWGLAVSQAGLMIAADDGAVWVPETGGQAVALGAFSQGEVTPDGLMILENSYAYARDFAVFRTTDGALTYIPEDNTGVFVYSPESGLLVRQRAASGDHATYELEILRRDGDSFKHAGALRLPVNDVELYLDSLGRMLSVVSGNGTQVYDLSTLRCVLDASGCALRYEDGALYALEAAGDTLFRCEFPDEDALEAGAEAEITSPLGRRVLSEEENRRYSFSNG